MTRTYHEKIAKIVQAKSTPTSKFNSLTKIKIDMENSELTEVERALYDAMLKYRRGMELYVPQGRSLRFANGTYFTNGDWYLLMKEATPVLNDAIENAKAEKAISKSVKIPKATLKLMEQSFKAGWELSHPHRLGWEKAFEKWLRGSHGIV